MEELSLKALWVLVFASFMVDNLDDSNRLMRVLVVLIGVIGIASIVMPGSTLIAQSLGLGPSTYLIPAVLLFMNWRGAVRGTKRLVSRFRSKD